MASLNFKGKTFVQNHHLAVEHHELIPVKEKSVLTKGANCSLHDNLIIHGDNLKALKALLPTYAGKVKCVYIDPPYNNGSEDWVYNDNVNSPLMKEWLGKVVDKEDLTRHEKWLSMMMPRLKLLRELLSQNGVIFVSIDDNEQHRLRLLLDEIFGEENFIAQMIWEGAGKNDARQIGINHEYVLVYARDKTTQPKEWLLGKVGVEPILKEARRLIEKHGLDFEEASNGLAAWYRAHKSTPSFANRRFRYIDQNGVYKEDDPTAPGGRKFQLINPKNKKPIPLRPNRGWAFDQDTFDQMVAQGRISFVTDSTIMVRRYLHETDKFTPQSVFYQPARSASERLAQIIPPNSFEYPKDEAVIKDFIEMVTSGADKDAIILDSFAGSGTTAHAVLQLNKEDGGNRKFILIECEEYADKITAERVRRVINGIPTSKDENLKVGLGGTFSFFELGKPIAMESILSGKNMPSYAELARFVFYTATGDEFNESKIDEKRHFIGETKKWEVYLYYKPDIEYLKATALNLEDLEALGKKYKKRRLIFAPTKYVEQDWLDEYGVDFSQLPFEIYRFAERT